MDDGSSNGDSRGRERWELDARPVDVIAIGSQVVYGSVGLSASVPILASHGLRVAALPTAVLSNLPHYRNVHALGVDPDWVPAALHDLTELGVAAEAATVYTGYFAAPAQVVSVADWLRDLLRKRPALRVVVDPTLGDHDVGAYTDPSVAEALREELLPLATGLVPNLFELQRLAGRVASREQPPVEELLADARAVLGARGEWVVVTGLTAATGTPERHLGEDLVVTRSGSTPVRYERMSSGAKGTGDLMAAAVIAGLHDGLDIVRAVERAGSVVRRGLQLRRIDSSDSAFPAPTSGDHEPNGNERGTGP